MLTKCPECELQVSDKAATCPHCGYPLQPTSKPRKTRKSNKRRRLPNGFGQISEIKNRNLRNPFRAMVTVGKDQNGRPICKPLKPDSYFPTYNDAYAALVEYNKNPYDLEDSIKVIELYEKWTAEYFKTISPASIDATERAWEYCKAVYSMRAKDLRPRHIKGCMEEGTAIVKGKEQHADSRAKIRIKTLFNLMLDYALEYELVDRNYARSFNVDDDTIQDLKTPQTEHIPFTDEEMEILWRHVDDKQFVDVILIQCYSGWRPQELCALELKNVDLKNWAFQGGLKTKAGIDRVVPIHPKIRGLVEHRYKKSDEIGGQYLFSSIDKRNGKTIGLRYQRYQRIFTMLKEELHLNPDHRPHDGRKHFVTMAKKYGVDEYAIKYIVGHVIADITEKVYTQREFSWLQKEIEKIK